MSKVLVFDLETQNGFGSGGFRDFSDVKVSVLCAIDEEGKEYTYWEDELPKFIEEMQKASMVVGFNISGFDLPVLQNYTDIKLLKLPMYDILDEFKKVAGHRIKLESLAQTTLGYGKSGSGLDALKYWAEGRKEELAKYCMDDVVVTKHLFDHVSAGKPVKYLDLMAPKELILAQPVIEKKVQDSLF